MMDSIDCFDRYKRELGWSFCRTIPTAEFKYVLDTRLKMNDLEKFIIIRHKLDEKKLNEWITGRAERTYIAGPVWGIKDIYDLKLEYFRKKLGDCDEVRVYSELLQAEKNMMANINKIISKVKLPAGTEQDLSRDDKEKENDLFFQLDGLFNHIIKQYGLTKEEFYIWLRANGVKGESKGLFEVIPDLELYEIEFLRERLGDVEEVREYEMLATRYAEISSKNKNGH